MRVRALAWSAAGGDVCRWTPPPTSRTLAHPAVTRAPSSLRVPGIKSHNAELLEVEERSPPPSSGPEGTGWAQGLSYPVRIALAFSAALQACAESSGGVSGGPRKGVVWLGRCCFPAPSVWLGRCCSLPLPPQGADGAGVQDAGHADGQDGAGLPARHRPLQPRYRLLPRPGVHPPRGQGSGAPAAAPQPTDRALSAPCPSAEPACLSCDGLHCQRPGARLVWGCWGRSPGQGRALRASRGSAGGGRAGQR